MTRTNYAILRNLKNVEEGKPLDIPLSVLNGEFKRKYFICLACGTPISEHFISGYCKKCLPNTPERRKWRREACRRYYHTHLNKKNDRRTKTRI